MPGMDGFTLMDRLRENPAWSGKFIVMLTPRGGPSEAARCEQLGVAASLFKPVMRSELTEAISTALGAQSSDELLGKPCEGKPLGQEPLRQELRQESDGFRILIAEDTPSNLAVMTNVLERRGYVAEAVNNGREALAALAARPFDLLLTDIQMPEMDGIQTTAAIRAKEKGSRAHLPIIAVTAHAMPGDRERCLKAGMDDYLSKPFRAHELFDAIERLKAPGAYRAEAAPDEKPAEIAKPGPQGDPGKSREISLLAQSLTMLGAVQTAIADKDLDAIRTQAGAMKGSITSLIAKGAFEAASILASTAQENDLARAEDACRSLREALTSLTGA
jgi:two-component system sensor histidine kinase/response regulator